MPVIDIGYTPHPKQKQFHESVAHDCLFGGARGPGKTTALAIEGLRACLQYNPKTGIPFDVYVFRRTFAELEKGFITEAMRWIPKDIARYVNDSHTFNFKNGARIICAYLEKESDVMVYQGMNIPLALFDEITHFSKNMFEGIRGSVRCAKELNYSPRIRVTGNPGRHGHGWVKQYFIDPHPEGGMHAIKIHSDILNEDSVRLVEFIPARAIDNLEHLDKSYIYMLEHLSPKLKKAWLYGDWSVFEGQVFDEFVDDKTHYLDRQWTHVIEPFPIPKTWRRYCSLDWGYTKPFSVGWWAIDPFGRAYRYMEWYGAWSPDVGVKLPPDEVARKILEYEKEFDVPGASYIRIADPALYKEESGQSIARTMMKQGVTFRQGDRHRIPGKMQLHNRLMFDEYGMPRLYVFNICEHFIRTIQNLSYDLNHPEDVDTKGEDHIYDETRYFLMANPLPLRTEIIQPTRTPVRDPFNRGPVYKRR